MNYGWIMDGLRIIFKLIMSKLQNYIVMDELRVIYEWIIDDLLTNFKQSQTNHYLLFEY